jgi:co-chaperonin GroES (HSP10)
LPNIRPLSRRVLVQRKVPVYEGKLFIPPAYQGKFFYGLVLDVSDDCDKSITKDSFILIEWNGNKQELQKNIWLVDETSVVLVKKETIWKAIGNRILLLRDNKEKKTEAGLLITDQQRENTQSLYGTVISLGYKDNEEIVSELSPGDYVCITEWNPHHKEVGLYGQYLLSVRTKDIACRIEKK